MTHSKTTMMLGAAVLALAVATPASAQQGNTNVKVRGDTAAYVDYSSDAETITKQEVERTLDKAGDSIKRAADKVAGAADNEMQAATAVQLNDTQISQNDSAGFMIGKPVMNAAGERVGTVHDLILSRSGSIDALIVADGGRMMIGDKKAAFPFSVVNGRDAEGGVLTSITEEQIDQAKSFDYDMTAQADAQTQIRAPGQSGARDLLGAKIEDADGKNIGTVRDLAINAGGVSKVVIAYDQILGLGGKRAAVDYQGLNLSPDDKGRLAVTLSAPQAAMLSR